MEPNHSEPCEDTETPADLLRDLQQRANALLSDLRAYQATLQAHNKQREAETRTFKRSIESEVKSLNAVVLPTLSSTANQSAVLDADSDHNDYDEDLNLRNSIHALRSANLPFYEAVWNIAQFCVGIVALGKRVHYTGRQTSPSSKQDIASANDRTTSTISNVPQNQVHKNTKNKSAVVDIIADDGLEWIKVSTVTEKRLLFEMAKEGWEGYGPSSGSEDGISDRDEQADGDRNHKQRRGSDEPQLELVRLARILYAASKETRVRFRHPRVKFVLPKVKEGLFEDVDAVIADIRSIGVDVVCATTDTASIKNGTNTKHQTTDEITTHLNKLSVDSTSIVKANSDTNKTTYLHLLPGPTPFHPIPTTTLNIDCTILLALISDISHTAPTNLPPYPTNPSGAYHKAIIKQIDAENTTPLLPTELYPLLTARQLLCTDQAAQRMREIVATMGTPTERQRADILFGANNNNNNATSLRTALARISCHPVPEDLNLPVHVVDFNFDFEDKSLSTITESHHLSTTEQHVLTKIPGKMNLSVINKSVFLYGWLTGHVTVTSNRVVALGLVRAINGLLDEDEYRKTGRGSQRDGGEGEGDDDDERDVFLGPKLYVCDTARSLIGKEKQGCSV